MDCKDALNMIPDYLEDKLNIKKTKAFLAHIGECENCKEELRIQYLVSEGTLRLEDGDSFDLNKELELKLAKSQKSIARKHLGNIVIYTMEAIALAAVLFILILVFGG